MEPFLSESGTYYAPQEGSLEELKEYTRGLPVEDPPETFGLHPNADITFQQVLLPQIIASPRWGCTFSLFGIYIANIF